MRNYINELEVGQCVKETLILKTHVQKTTKAGKPYLDLVLVDKTGELKCKMWDGDEVYQEFKDGDILGVELKVEEFNNSLQGKISSITRIDKESVPNDVLKELVPHIEENPEELFDELINTLESLDAPNYKDFAVKLLKKCKKNFISYPGAKSMHHAEVGGLLLHTIEVVRIVQALYDAIPCFDKNLCMVGAALHDIGKLLEFTLGETGLVSEYSTSGELLGHIYMGTQLVGSEARKFNVDKEYCVLLQHMILSHHGKMEYGSPVLPKTIEAYILSEADMISAKAREYNDAIKHVKPGEFSSRIFGLDANIFNPSYKNGDSSVAENHTDNDISPVDDSIRYYSYNDFMNNTLSENSDDSDYLYSSYEEVAEDINTFDNSQPSYIEDQNDVIHDEFDDYY